MAQIKYDDITKSYDSDTILDKINLEIYPGEFVFVVGPSGAGKSTLIKLLIREELPDSGKIYFEDQNILDIPHEEIHQLRRRIGVVFQDFKLLNSKNVFDNVAVALEVVDSKEDVVKRVVRSVLGMVGLTNKMFNYPDQLSGGEKQRVSIARALAHEPNVLIADEPTGMIDPESSKGIVEILEKINSLGTTVIMATHDQDIVNRLKKRVIRIENGIIKSDKHGGKYNE
jgi:cell division transport system ATP-binding protein